MAHRLIKIPTLSMVTTTSMSSLSLSLCSLQRLCFSLLLVRALKKCLLFVCFCFLVSSGERKAGRSSRSEIPHNMRKTEFML